MMKKAQGAVLGERRKREKKRRGEIGRSRRHRHLTMTRFRTQRHVTPSRGDHVLDPEYGAGAEQGKEARNVSIPWP